MIRRQHRILSLFSAVPFLYFGVCNFLYHRRGWNGDSHQITLVIWFTYCLIVSLLAWAGYRLQEGNSFVKIALSVFSMESFMDMGTLTNEALAFEVKAKTLKDHVLKHIYYTPDFEGAINIRARGEEEFEYAPLSRLFFEKNDGSFFEFRDSSAFLSYYGYYHSTYLRTINPCLFKKPDKTIFFNGVNTSARRLKILLLNVRVLSTGITKQIRPTFIPCA